MPIPSVTFLVYFWPGIWRTGRLPAGASAARRQPDRHVPAHRRNLQYWNSTSNAWATSTGSYGIEAGDSDANLPLTGTLAVSSAQLGQPVTITSPGPQEELAGTAVSLAETGTANGALVDLYQCNGTGAQVWQPQPDGALVNPQSGACLDDTNWSTTPGAQVQIWSCTGNANQSWTLP